MQRVTYRRRLSYNTKSNKTRTIKTPGGALRLLHISKKATAPKCGDCGIALPGVPALRPTGYMRLSSRQKSVNRAYGGSRCALCVRSRCGLVCHALPRILNTLWPNRVLRAFLIEEQKIVKRVLKLQEKESAAAEASKKKKSKGPSKKKAVKK